MAALHKNLVSGGWGKLSFATQLANIGSEVSRVIHWQEAGDKVEKERALARTLELLDLTLTDSEQQSHTNELARLREVLCDVFAGRNEYGASFESLEDYFLPFALLSLKGRH